VHSSWQDFLAARGAHIEAGAIAHFGSASAESQSMPSAQEAQSSTIVTDLSHFGLVEASGIDARDFLNNQLTSDVEKIDSAGALYAGYCSPKGRLLANFLLWPHGEGFLLQLDAGLREAIQKRLAMYVMRSKVKLNDASDRLVRLGVAGTDARDLLTKLVTTPPQDNMALVRQDDLSVIRLDATRYQVVLPAAQAPAAWSALAAHARPVGAQRWRWLDIRAGIAWITRRTQEQFVPQMTNFDRIGALSYGKGCYPGQEIVARMHYLGKLKRRMYLAHVAGTNPPQPGDELFGATFGEQSCGMIVNAEAAPEGGYDVLAVLQIESLKDDIHIGSMSGITLAILDQPYTLG
jgi:folate-binding protein YgfZ